MTKSEYHVHEETSWPIPIEQRPKVLAALELFHSMYDPAEWTDYPWDPYYTVLFLWETGAHPDVIAHPIKRQLHLEDEGTVICWFRPKTKKAMKFPVSPMLAPWVAGYIESVRAVGDLPPVIVTQKYWVKGQKEARERKQDLCSNKVTRLVKRVFRVCGFPNYTPRTLRHTRGRRILETTRDITNVRRFLGTSLEVAGRYAETKDDPTAQRIARGEV
jgi:integrase